MLKAAVIARAAQQTRAEELDRPEPALELHRRSHIGVKCKYTCCVAFRPRVARMAMEAEQTRAAELERPDPVEGFAAVRLPISLFLSSLPALGFATG